MVFFSANVEFKIATFPQFGADILVVNCGISKIATFGVNIGVEICDFLLSSDTEDRFDVVFFFNCGISKIATFGVNIGVEINFV